MLAFAMAGISILAAGLALRTALLGATAALLDSRAIQELAERQQRQQYLALVIAQDRRLFSSYVQYNSTLSVELAGAGSATNADAAADLQLQAEATFDLMRATSQFFQRARPVLDGDQLRFPGVQALAENISNDLRLRELQPSQTVASADREHRSAFALVEAAVFLVGALVFLTLAQVFRGRWAPVSSALGFGIAIGVAWLTAANDDVIRIPMTIATLVIVVGCVPIQWAVWRSARRPGSSNAERDATSDIAEASSHMTMRSRALTERLSFPEPTIAAPAELGSFFGRSVAVLIAVATLIAAIAGYLQGSAFHSAEEAARAAQSHALDSLNATQQAVDSAEAEINVTIQYATATVNELNARQAAAYYTSVGRDTFAAASSLDGQRWHASGEATLAGAGIGIGTSFGPCGYSNPGDPCDPQFPLRYLTAAQHDALVDSALQDAANEESGLWNGQGSLYTATLAILAVTLYLLGLSLILPTRTLGRLFVGLSLLFMAVSIMIGVLQVTSAPADQSARARATAENFADGEIELRTASNATDLDRAITHLSHAVDGQVGRPNFAVAHRDLSNAEFAKGSPQTAGYKSIVDPTALSDAIHHLRESIRLGLDNADTRSDLGFYLFRQALATPGDSTLYEESAAATRRAVELDPGLPVPYYNLGVALLGANNFDAARKAYADSISPTLYVDELNHINRSPEGREQIVAGALTDLESLRKVRPDLSTSISDLKKYLVVTTSGLPEVKSAAVRDMALTFVGSTLLWTARMVNFDPNPSSMSVQWYRLDQQSGEWYVMPEISGAADVHPDPKQTGLYFGEADLTTAFSPPRCLDAGHYRVELYMNNSAPIASQFLTIVALDQVVESNQAMRIAYCRPSAWIPDSRRVAGFVDGYRNVDGMSGVIVIRAHVANAAEESTADRLLATLIQYSSLLPGIPSPYSDPTSGRNSIVLNTPVSQVFDDGAGFVFAQIGVEDYGALVVVAVYGPYGAFGTQQRGLLAVTDSLSEVP